MFVVTPEMILNANDYVNLKFKNGLAQEQAAKCVVETEEKTGVKLSDEVVMPLPPKYKVDGLVRSALEMSVFVSLYLKVKPVDDDGNITISLNEYDEYMSSHIFDQMNSLKRSKNEEVKQKVFRILDDYNDYQKRLSAEIKAQLDAKNDFCDRLISMMIMTSSQDVTSHLLELYNKSEAQLKEEVEKRRKRPKKTAPKEVVETETKDEENIKEGETH